MKDELLYFVAFFILLVALILNLINLCAVVDSLTHGSEMDVISYEEIREDSCEIGADDYEYNATPGGAEGSAEGMVEALRQIAKFGKENPRFGFTCSKLAEAALNAEAHRGFDGADGFKEDSRCK